MVIALIIIGSVILFLLLVFFSALYSIYRLTFYSPFKGQNSDHRLSGPQYNGLEKEVYNLVENILKIPYEDAYIKSYDGLKLHAYIYPNAESKKVAIMCHGYRGTARRDFSGGAAELIGLGINVILIDERAHGLSQGHSITFGRKEKKDVLSWVDFAKQRFGEDIELILVGISMGGATVLYCADKVENAKIVADCPYVTPSAILKNTIRHMKLNVKLFFPILNLASIIFGHANMDKDNAFENMKNNRGNKIMIIHGEKDTLVPYHMTEELYLAYKNQIRYELFKDATHGMAYLYDRPRYKKLIKEFVEM